MLSGRVRKFRRLLIVGGAALVIQVAYWCTSAPKPVPNQPPGAKAEGSVNRAQPECEARGANPAAAQTRPTIDRDEELIQGVSGTLAIESQKEPVSSGSSATSYRSEPISSDYPARQSDDPKVAGFPLGWAERSLEHRWAVRIDQSGWLSNRRVPALPLVQAIVSAKRQIDDSWAYQAEYEIRRIVTRSALDQPPRIARVFCNAHGCLCYLQGGAFSGRVKDVTLPLLRSSWARELRIASNAIYLVDGSPGPKGTEWIMFIVPRPSETISADSVNQ